jgi:AhpD family alkylhydroperoxidase
MTTSNQLSYPDLTQAAAAGVAALRYDQPGPMHGFRTLAEDALDAGAIPAKFKQLMALALAIASNCDTCIGLHAGTLVQMGATRAEIEETIAVAVYMGGEPSLMCGADALAAFKQFSQKMASAHGAMA